MSKNTCSELFSYPAMLKLKDKPCVIIGSGATALRKLISLGEAGAAITVISPIFTSEFEEIAHSYAAVLVEALYQPSQLKNAFLTIAATDNFEVNRQICSDAPFLCNNITEPDLGNFTVPAMLHQGDITITVATAGVPAFTRVLKEYLNDKLTPEYSKFLAFLRQMRQELKNTPSSPKERTLFWRKTLNKDILELLEKHELSRAKEIVLNAVTSFRSKS